MGLTPKQKKVLEFARRYSALRGFAPALREIGEHIGVHSLATVHQHLAELESKGYLQRRRNRPRSIEVLAAEKMLQIPLLGRIAAGAPIEAIEDRETIAVPQSRLPFPARECYALRVTGDSMIDENINDRDLVLVKKQTTAENGQKVVALIDGGDATLKTFYRERGHIRLQPANKDYAPIIIKNGRDFAIQGIALGVIQEERPVATALPKPQKTVERPAELPLNKIICGDAVRIMQQMPENSIDLTVTSPPYDELRNYNGYIFDFEGIARNLFRVTKRGGVLVWVVGDKIKNGNRSLTSFKQALFFQKIGFNVHDIMIYKKKNTPFMRTNAYTNCFEFMLVLSKGKPKTFSPLKVKTARQGTEMLVFNKGPDGVNKKILGELKPQKTMTNIWEFAVGLHGTTSDKIAFKHPAVFPEKLAEGHILSWTKQGDVVFDPMCGSGTTCKMAALHKRSYIGCDISKEYVGLTKERMRKVLK